MFTSQPEENAVNFMYLIFPDLEIAKQALANLKTWKEINIAFVEYPEGMKFCIYQDVGDTYMLQTNYTEENNILLKEFLKNQPTNLKFALTTSIWKDKRLWFESVPPELIVIPTYIRSDSKTFRLPNIGKLN